VGYAAGTQSATRTTTNRRIATLSPRLGYTSRRPGPLAAAAGSGTGGLLDGGQRLIQSTHGDALYAVPGGTPRLGTPAAALPILIPAGNSSLAILPPELARVFGKRGAHQGSPKSAIHRDPFLSTPAAVRENGVARLWDAEAYEVIDVVVYLAPSRRADRSLRGLPQHPRLVPRSHPSRSRLLGSTLGYSKSHPTSSCVPASLYPPFQIEFISALRGSRVGLTTLSLTRVERATNEPDLRKIAMQLASTNPSLRKVTLRYSFTTWVFLDSIPYQRVGNFVVKDRSKQGSPVLLEKRPRSRRRCFYRRPFSLARWI
jgi:hypothetical protein